VKGFAIFLWLVDPMKASGRGQAVRPTYFNVSSLTVKLLYYNDNSLRLGYDRYAGEASVHRCEGSILRQMGID